MKTFATIVLVAATTLVACSSKQTHPGAAPECSPGVDCVGVGPSPGGGGPPGTTDSGTKDATIADAGHGTLTITNGHVVTAQSFTNDPAAAPLDATETNLSVIATANGSPASAAVSGGNFTFSGLDVTPPLNKLELDGRNATTGVIGARTLFFARIEATTTTIDTLSIPSFDAAFVAGAYGAFGFQPPSVTNYGTVIVQLVDASGAAVTGASTTNPAQTDAGLSPQRCPVTSSPTPTNCGPFYDKGNALDVTDSTSSQGTIGFLSIPPGLFSFRIAYSDGALVDVSLPVALGAVTFLRANLR